MDTFVLMSLQESMAQCSAGQHDYLRRYMNVLLVNHRIITSISTLTAVIRLVIKLDADNHQHCFHYEVKWTIAISSQLSTLPALDLKCIHHLPDALGQEKGTYCLPEGNRLISNALRRIQSGGDHKALVYCLFLIESNGM